MDMLSGRIVKVLPQNMVEVLCDDGRIVIATVGVVAKRSSIHIALGHRVSLQVFERDPSRGRLVSGELS